MHQTIFYNLLIINMAPLKVTYFNKLSIILLF